jgi:hypothetical protein
LDCSSLRRQESSSKWADFSPENDEKVVKYPEKWQKSRAAEKLASPAKFAGFVSGSDFSHAATTAKSNPGL